MSPERIRHRGELQGTLCRKTQELLGQDLEVQGPEGLDLRVLNRRNCWEQIGKLKGLKG